VTYEVLLLPSAQRELDKLPADAFQTADLDIRALRDNPRPHGVKKLEGILHRIRVGPWRIIYAIQDTERRVIILRIARRSERTYRRLPRF